MSSLGSAARLASACTDTREIDIVLFLSACKAEPWSPASATSNRWSAAPAESTDMGGVYQVEL
ncbi:hypothetical protein [Sorangium sp. So ce1335]|uniref:hypothetical protein n=1 Tax=Sorangium sp. So ce1335 TaxID=3133335 RepID=UPI003F5DC49E